MSAVAAKPKMIYKTLGATGLVVSQLSYGTWGTYGVKPECTEEVCIETLKVCKEYGVNFYDMAEAYGTKRGDAEIIFGNALKKLDWDRSSYVITTKIFWGGETINEKGVSRKHILEGLNKCLKRLQLDYVDVVFAHRRDPLTPIEETVRAFTHAINEGKALYWGTSEWSAHEITEAYWVARLYNLIPPSVEQPQYNMFFRERVEKEYKPLYKFPYGLGTTIWSPLASGALTGKYNDGVPAGSRFDTEGYDFLVKRLMPHVPKVKLLVPIAERLGCSMAQLSIAWCMKSEGVSTVLLGSSRVEQLKENLGSLDVYPKLTAEVMAEIAKILDNAPAEEMNYGRAL